MCLFELQSFQHHSFYYSDWYYEVSGRTCISFLPVANPLLRFILNFMTTNKRTKTRTARIMTATSMPTFELPLSIIRPTVPSLPSTYFQITLQFPYLSRPGSLASYALKSARCFALIGQTVLKTFQYTATAHGGVVTDPLYVHLFCISSIIINSP